MDSLRISRLTDRQRLCLRLVHAHLSSKEIATQVGIGPGTVDQHIKAALLILGVCDRRAAARLLADYETATSERPIEEAPPETPPDAALPPVNVMDKVLPAIRHGLGNVLNFSGRDTREQFRIYLIFLFAMGMACPLFIVQTRGVIAFTRIYEAAVAHPERSRNAFQWKHDYPELWPQFGDLPLILALVSCLYLALIAAAIARRRHAWNRTELWGLLAPIVANIAIGVKPGLPLLILPLSAEAMMIYAFVRGGAPERIAAANFAVGTALLFFAVSVRPFHVGGVDISVFVSDSIGLLVFLVLALRANRFWPIWMAALYGLGLAAHLIMLMNPMVAPAAYGAFIAITGPFLLLVMCVGVHNHQLRLRQNGVDPAWTPRRSRRPAKLAGRGEEQIVGGQCVEA